MSRNFWSLACTAFCVAVMLMACAKPGLPPPPDPDPLDREAYVIEPGDVIGIAVYNNNNISVPRVPVRPDGKISVPLLDDVQAAGLTPEELKELLTRSLSEFVQNPNVTVVVLEVNSKRVYILKEGGNATAFQLRGDMRVLDLIAATGGFTQFSNKRDIRILRREGGGIVEYRFDYDGYLDGEAPESNLLLQAGDTVVIPD